MPKQYNNENQQAPSQKGAHHDERYNGPAAREARAMRGANRVQRALFAAVPAHPGARRALDLDVDVAAPQAQADAPQPQP